MSSPGNDAAYLGLLEMATALAKECQTAADTEAWVLTARTFGEGPHSSMVRDRAADRMAVTSKLLLCLVQLLDPSAASKPTGEA